MDERKEIILKTIIKEHIKTGAPVGSGCLVDKYKLNISPATVRNEMTGLEAEGYIIQPHTSAGRVPTEAAYRHFLSSLKPKNLSESDRSCLERILSEDKEEKFKEAAKELAKISNLGVFWAIHRHNIFYTGISNILQQPEFRELNLIYDISSIIDRIDEIIGKVFNEIELGESVLIGQDNPFGDFLSTVFVKYKKDENIGLLGILGPIRMDYEKNVALANHLKNILNQ